MLLKIKDNVVLAGHFQQWMDLKDYTLIKKARYYRSLNNRQQIVIKTMMDVMEVIYPQLIHM